MISSLVLPNTYFRCAGEVELYMWMTTLLRADQGSARSFRSSPHAPATSTWIVTSSGMRFVLDEAAVEAEFGVRGGGETDLDFFKTALHQRI